MDALEGGILRDKWPGSRFGSEESTLGDKRCSVERGGKLYLLDFDIDILVGSEGEAGIERRGDGSPKARRGRSESWT
jgi:hypothetical protein